MGVMLIVLKLLEFMIVSPSLHSWYFVGGRGGGTCPLRLIRDPAAPIVLECVQLNAEQCEQFAKDSSQLSISLQAVQVHGDIGGRQ